MIHESMNPWVAFYNLFGAKLRYWGPDADQDGRKYAKIYMTKIDRHVKPKVSHSGSPTGVQRGAEVKIT